ncbi:hypothetical protein FRC12_008693 [Ceratobasidium sp. 428]|nr:hypothetical protein FRC12_008693 [Ceratobasidium sp. 428]
MEAHATHIIPNCKYQLGSLGNLTRPNPPLPAKSYGALRPPSPDPAQDPSVDPHTENTPAAEIKRHWLGQSMLWFAFGIVIAPLLGLVPFICYGLVSTISMVKRNGALLNHLWLHPLKIRFCAAPLV